MTLLKFNHFFDFVDVRGVYPYDDVLREGLIHGVGVVAGDSGAGDPDVIDIKLVSSVRLVLS